MFLVLCALGAAGNVAAEPPTDPAAKRGDVTNYSFDDDRVLGDGTQPSVEHITVLQRSGRESLIRVREHFIPELYKSVETL